MCNRFQKAMVKAYAEGDFSGVTTAAEVLQTGDGLFQFLYIELSKKEGCETKHEALRRLDNILRELEQVIVAVENSPDDLAEAA